MVDLEGGGLEILGIEANRSDRVADTLGSGVAAIDGCAESLLDLRNLKGEGDSVG